MCEEIKKIILLSILIFTFWNGSVFGKEIISFGLVSGFRPVTFVGEDKKPEGFVIELYSRIMDEYGYEPTFVVGNFKDLYNQLLSNQLDFFGTLTRRPDRENLFFWPNEPTITGWGQLFVAHGKTVNNINQIKGSRIGLVTNEAKGRSFITHMSSLGIPFEKIYFPNFKAVIAAVTNEEVFAGVANNTIVATNTSIEPTGVIFAPSSAYSTTAAKNEKMIPLVKQFNARMAELKSNPNSYYWGLYQKWFSPARIETRIIPTWLIWVMSVFAVGMVSFFIIAQILRYQVLARTADLKRAHEELEDKVEERTFKLQEEIDERVQIEEYLYTAKQEAIAANQSKSEFLSTVSHELRTPIHQILSFSKFGIDKINQVTKDKILHYFKNINTISRRLQSLLDDLLDLAKLESGKLDYDMQKNDLKQIIDSVTNEFVFLVREKKLLFEITAEEIPTTIICDKNRISQVIRNLISNAIKFSPRSKKIAISITDGTLTNVKKVTDDKIISNIKVAIEDEGLGIPKKELETVFDKFIQSSNTKTKVKGTGLGLAICKELVEAHNGTIAAENKPEGGAKFSFILPYVQSLK
jgi:signal transduction histidine kinase